MLRRAFIGGVCVGAFTPRVLAFDGNSYGKIRDRVAKNVQIDTEKARKYIVDDLKSWEPSKGFGDVIESCKNDAILDELSYMKVMYDPPLKPYQRVYVSKKLLMMLDSVTTDEQARYIVNIMKYYDLYSDE